jgi:hypothetical protein
MDTETTDSEFNEHDVKMYRPKQKHIRAKGIIYIDANKLHELLCIHAKDEKRVVGRELAIMYISVVDNIMKSINLYRYNNEWRDQMKHNAICALLKYAHNYNPEKGRIRRDQLNEVRIKKLAPIDDGKTAFNYVSWIASTTINSTILKLKEKEEKMKLVGLNDDVIVDISEVSDDNLNHYNNRLVEDLGCGYDDIGEPIDPLADKRVMEKAKDDAQAEEIITRILGRNQHLKKSKLKKAEKKMREAMDLKIAK